ncbi:ribokinase [Microvirga tunisiensis]|uniref:Ribokinase n=1 Tax=Pannonibacter tanglangensis TaxID=2750084 RepID=A0A7X5F3R9_9HYPH|nr:ribokinase [Pannonibacter sp. XCT-53]NBN79211.1 ribokinase [Pannonibacter sp. XCT-53]
MIVVFGSINLDLVVMVKRLPLPGETSAGPDCQTFAGGKGANQALAARRAGAAVRMVGAVGTDAFATPALANLAAAGVDLSALRRLEGSTGIAMIGVEAAGENLIIVGSGVNARVSANWLSGQLAAGETLLMQAEIPLAEAARAIDLAEAAGARVIFNTAPATDPAVARLAARADVVISNESEAADVAAALGLPQVAAAYAAAMAATGRIAVVTLGSDGVLAHDGTTLYRVAPPQVAVVDTTGAGDAFCGALATALDRGADLGQALAEGVAAGSLACTATGAQSSAPDAADIARLAATLSVRRG